MLLTVEGLGSSYGAVQVLWDINVAVAAGEIVALVGSNGAGKTTLLRTLSGLLPEQGGQVRFRDREINGLGPEARIKLGLAMVPEGRRLFGGMTVEENIIMGGFTRPKAEGGHSLERMYDLFPELAERKKQLAGTMSGGQQQMCAIARGLMSEPQLLLIDELSLGLAPVVTDRLVDLLLRIAAESNVAVLLVEQDVQLAFEIAARGYVLETGRVAMSGVASELLANPEVKRAYIGV